ARVRRLVAEDDRPPDRGALDLVHQAELHLAVALAAELWRKVGSPQLLALDLFLQRLDSAPEAGLVEIGDFERIHLVAHETAHPFELLPELGLGREVPGHASSAMPSSIMPVMVDVSPSYMGSGRLPRRCSIRL